MFRLSGVSIGCCALAASTLLITAARAQTPLGTAFTYQGQLKQNGSPANGTFNMVFSLWDDPAAGSQIGPTLTFDGNGGNPAPVSVTSGLITVQLDFGSVYNGDKRWLDITVEGTPLTPRQELTTAPYARRAIDANSAASAASALAVPWSGITGVPSNVTGSFSPWSSPNPNSLAGWGANWHGEANVPAGTFTAVAAGYSHTIGVRTDGTLAGWGDNTYGQINVPSGSFTAVASGQYYSLAIRSNGTLASWGPNSYGETNVPAGTYIAVAAGDAHGLAIRSDGTLVGWGDNTFNQINVPSGTFTAVAAGQYHSLAIRSDGTLVGWGDNTNGQINVPSGTFTAVAARYNHSHAIRSDGTLAGWGNAGYGQNNLPSGTFIAVVDGGFSSLAIRSNGTLVGWGNNDYGQNTVPSGSFVAVASSGFNGFAVAHTTIGFNADAYVSGNLGVGTTSPTSKLSVAGSADFSGKVGIGLTTPANKLDVAGGAVIGGTYSGTNNAPANGFLVEGNVGIGTTSPATKVHVASNTDTELSIQSTASGGHRWTAQSSATSGLAGTFQIIDRTAGPSRLLIDGSGNVGIGTTIPGQKLDVAGAMRVQNGIIQRGTTPLSGTNDLGLYSTDPSFWIRITTNAGDIRFHTDGGVGTTPAAIISASGNVGMGTTSPSQKLHVVGNICATGTIGACSDARFKEHVETVAGALEKVEQLRGVTFDWKRDEFCDHQFAEGPQVGFIAQEVEKVLPQVVSTGSDGYKSVDYGRLTPVIVEAVKELKDENASLRAEVEELKKLVGQMRNQQRENP